MYARRIVVCLLSQVASCESGQRSFDVESDAYVASFCEVQCDVGRECNAEWYKTMESCVDDCLEWTYGAVEHVCFVPVIDESMCIYDRYSCEEIITNMISFAPGAPCSDFFERAGACLTEHNVVWNFPRDSD